MSYNPLDPATVAPLSHTHASSDVASGTIDTARLGSGTPDNTKFLRGDQTWAVPAGGGGDLTDGDKGDITVAASGADWTIDAGAVTYAKMQDVSATDKLLGRSTAGAGVVEEIACTAAGRALLDDAAASDQRTTLGLGALAIRNDVRLNQAEVTGPLPYSKLTPSDNASRLLGRGSAGGAGDWQEIVLGSGLTMTNTTLSSSGGAGISDGDKGDITVSASGATWTIDANAVSFSKLQDVGSSRILGRVTAGTGDTEELSLTNVLDMVGSAAQGDVLYRNASAWTRLGAGTSGQFLRTNGAGANPSWAASSSALTSNGTQLGVDVTMSSSNTWYQAVESATQSAGTYLLTATITMHRTATGARTYQARLTDESASVYASTAQWVGDNNPSGGSLSMTAIVLIPPLGSTKFRLWGLTSSGSASEAIVAALPSNGQGNNATTLSVVKIA